MFESLIWENISFIKNQKSFRKYTWELEVLVSEINRNKIVTISWLRHTGKNKLIAELISKTQSSDEVFYFNGDLDKIGSIGNEKDLMTLMDIYVRSYWAPKMVILQNISGIEGIKNFILKLYKAKKYKIVIVWNNIKIQGVKNIELFPLSLTEKNTENYIYGGIPEVRIIPDISYKTFLLEALKHDIISRDILEAYSIKNMKLFYRVMYYLSIQNTYSSLREIHRNLEHHGVDISLLTLTDYVNAGLNTHLLHRAYLYDIKWGKEISSKAQYFFWDVGIRYSFAGKNKVYLENQLFLEFLSRWYEVSWAINGRFEFEIYARKEKSSIEIALQKSWEDKNDIRKKARKLAKIESKSQKFIIVENKESLNMRKFEEQWVKIVELSEFIQTVLQKI